MLPALGAGRGRDHRPLRRLHAGLPGRRPRARRRRGRGGRALGHRRPAAAPDRRARPRARAPGSAGSRGATGSRASRWTSTQRARQAFLDLAAADPDHYLVLDAAGDRSTRSPPRCASRSRRCSGRRRWRRADDASGTTWSASTRWSRRCGAAAAGHGMSHAWLFTGPPGLGPLQRRGRVRRGAAVRAGHRSRLRRVPRVPHRARRHATPTSPLIRTEKLSIGVDEVRDLVRRAALAPGRAALADPHRRGRRPAHRPGLQRAAQGDRGADRPHRLDALRAHRRGRPADDPLALPAGHPGHADDRPRSPAFLVRADGVAPSRSRRTPPAPARATSAGPARWPATRPPATGAARSSRYPPGSPRSARA